MTLQSIQRAVKRDFTYGYEIEGAFRHRIARQLEYSGEFKDDGSVELHSDNPCFTPRYRLVEYDEGEIAKEYASKVHSNLQSMLKELAIFKGDNYFPDETAGLHVHIKPKTGKKVAEKLFLMLSDYQVADGTWRKFKDATQSWQGCGSLNSCYALRWGNLFYYNRYPSKIRFENDWAYGEKYRYYTLNQEYGTIEFRLFSPYPCHRQKALKLMFNDLLPKALYQASKKWRDLENHVVRIKDLPVKGRIKTKLTI